MFPVIRHASSSDFFAILAKVGVPCECAANDGVVLESVSD